MKRGWTEDEPVERRTGARTFKPPATPTLDRMHEEHPCDGKVITHSQMIGQFLDWLDAHQYVLVKEDPRFFGKAELVEDVYASTAEDPDDRLGRFGDPVTVYLPTHEGPSTLLHRYFEVDPNAEEAERRAILEEFRRR